MTAYRLKTAALCCVMMLLSACDAQTRQARGFSLPPGDKVAGERTFYALGCDSCHSIKGSKEVPPREDTGIAVVLGGKVGVVKSYGELVTSIINPSHRISKSYAAESVAVDGQSRMRVYNDVMTVTQLIDVVEFLQSKYELAPQIVSDYRMYSYP